MALSALANYGSDDESFSDEEAGNRVIDTKTKMASQPLKELLETKRVKQHPKNQRGIVQISLPRLNKSDELSDDEKEGFPKKSLLKTGTTGLTTLLPQPKRTPKRSNTSLVPPSIKKPKKTSLRPFNNSHVNDEGVEEDDTNDLGGAFFSNLDTSSSPLISDDTTKPLPLKLPSISNPTNSYLTANSSTQSHYTSYTSSPSTMDTPTDTYHHGNHEQYGGNVAGQSSSSYDYTTQQQYSSVEQPTTVGNKDELTLDEANFHRLAGSKRGRHKGIEEESLLNIKDVSQDDIKDAVAYKKHLTEGHSHTSGTVPEDLAFSSTQKRKHQIHWLAAQAKAKEQELKNFWSAAAATRRQTQMKYGF